MPGATATPSGRYSSSVVIAVFTAAFLLPAALPLHDEAEILIGEELMQNDDLILSRPNSECPEDDEDDCTYDTDASNKDALIYPMSLVTTRKPPRQQHPATAAVTELSTTPRSSSNPDQQQLCVGDDEDCSGSSGVDELPTLAQSDPTTIVFTNHLATVYDQQATPTRSSDPVRPSPTRRPPRPTRPSDVADNRLPPVSAMAPPLRDPVTPGQRYSSLGGEQNQQRGPSSLAAISMNIILIVGIAAAFVVLLLILIFAVCAYSRQRPVAGPGGRSRTKTSSGKTDVKGYAYEACNTSPPMPVCTAPVIVNACNYQPVPGAAGPYSAAMSMTFQPMSPDTVDVKPQSKKDVKEWYV